MTINTKINEFSAFLGSEFKNLVDTVSGLSTSVSDALTTVNDAVDTLEESLPVLEDLDTAFTVNASGTVYTFDNSNIQLSPIGSSGSFSYYGGSGATNYWGGPASENQEGAGFTAYALTHASYGGDLKLRFNNKRCWLHSSSVASDIDGSMHDHDSVGTWDFESTPLINVGEFKSRGITDRAVGSRLRVNDDDLSIGSLSGTQFGVYNQNSSSYVQYSGGTNQANGFNVRLYGGSTSATSTDFGMIWYADNNQVVRYRNDLQELEIKSNTKLKLANLDLSGLPTSSAGLSAGMAYLDGNTVKVA